MSPEDRALVVRRLRQEADRIEAGGEPRECCARGEYSSGDYEQNLDEARREAESLIQDERDTAADSYWHDEVRGIRWGVVVTVEEARVVERRCAYDIDTEADEVIEYGLVDAGAPVADLPLDPCDHCDCCTCNPCCSKCGEPCDELIDEYDMCPDCAAKLDDVSCADVPVTLTIHTTIELDPAAGERGVRR